MAKQWAFVNPAWDTHPAQTDGKRWTNLVKEFITGAGGRYYDEGEVGLKGAFGIHVWTQVVIGGKGYITAEYEFNAPCFMILDKFTCQNYRDVSGTGNAWWYRLIIEVNGRAKRIDIAHPLRRYMDIPGPGVNRQWVPQVVDVRPVIIKPGDRVKIRVRLMADTAYGEIHARVADCHLLFRASVRLGWDFGARSWLSARRELLPEDLLTVHLSGVDEENGLVPTGYPVQLWHGPSRPPSLYVGEVILGSPVSFPAFGVRSTPGMEYLMFKSDGDDNYLGIATTYGPYETDDPAYDAVITTPSFEDSISALKRTPKITFDELPAKLRLEELVNFSGGLEDPDQPGLLDFLGNIECHLTRNGVSIAFSFTDADGKYVVPYTLDLAGADFAWQIETVSSTQYNAATSRIQTRSVWEVIATILKLLTDRTPPFYDGSWITLTAELRRADTEALLPDMPVTISQVDGGSKSGTTDTKGQFKWPFFFDRIGDYEFGTVFNGAEVAGYQEYQPSSDSRILSIIEYSVATVLGLTVELGEVPLGELIKLGATITPAVAGLAINLERYKEPTEGEREEFHKMGDVNWDGVIDDVDLDLMRAAYGSVPGDPNWNPDYDLNGDGVIDIFDVSIAASNYGKTLGWLLVKTGKTDVDGKCLFDLDSTLLGEGTFQFRVTFLGFKDKTTSPYTTYEPSTSPTLSVSVVPAPFSALDLRVRLDDKLLEPGDWESLTFEVEGVGVYDTPQLVEVAPGTYNITCTLVAIAYPPQTVTKTVHEGEIVPVEFNFYTPKPPPPPTGRVRLAVTPSKLVASVGEEIEIYAVASIIGIIRSVPLPFAKITIIADGEEVARSRSDVFGRCTLSWVPPTVGKYEIHGEVKVLMERTVAKSNYVTVTAA